MTSRLRRDLHFAPIPEWVLFHADLTPQAIRLYAVLVRRADRDNQCFPSRSLLAEDLRVGSEKTVDRALKELVTAAAVTVEERYDDAGDRTSNRYTVHLAPPEGVASRMSPPLDIPVPTGGDTDDATGGDTDAPTGGDTDDSVTRASSKYPQAPAERGPDPRDVDRPRPDAGCASCRGRRPCRSCGTTPRQLERAAARDAEQRRRDRNDAAIQADRRRKGETADVDATAHAKAARKGLAAARGGGAR